MTEHSSATEHDINNQKETFQSTGSPLHALQIWLTLVHKQLRTVDEFLPTPYIFTLGETASHTTCMLYNRQQENFGMCYVVAGGYSLEQQNAGRAHAGSVFYMVLYGEWSWLSVTFLGCIDCTLCICIRCSLLLQMLYVAWSVCLCVGHTDVKCGTE